MADKEYVCAYKNHCLHHGEKVKASEAVVIGDKRYHWDCAETKQKLKECVDLYMSYIEDKTQYPIVVRTINNLVFKDGVPIDFIFERINGSKSYYANKPVLVLYGLRKLFWEKEFRA